MSWQECIFNICALIAAVFTVIFVGQCELKDTCLGHSYDTVKRSAKECGL